MECIFSKEMCSDGERFYKPGERFIPADCSGSCYCFAGGLGRACVSLCPPIFVECKIGEVKIQSQYKIANSSCTCPYWKCVKAKRTGNCYFLKYNLSAMNEDQLMSLIQRKPLDVFTEGPSEEY